MRTPGPRPVYIVPPPEPPHRWVTPAGIAGTLIVLGLIYVVVAAPPGPASDGLQPAGTLTPVTAEPTIDPRIDSTKTAILARFDAASTKTDKACRKGAGNDNDKLADCNYALSDRNAERSAILSCFSDAGILDLSERLTAVKLCETDH